MMFATTGWGACMNAACTKAMWIYHVFWTCPAAWQLRKTFITPWKRLGLEGATEEHACFSLELPAVPQAIWELAATSNMQAGAHDALLDVNITALMEGCWRLGAALYFHAVWRWRVEHFDETNDVSAARHNLLLATRQREGYASMHFYVNPTGHRRLLSTAAGIVKQALRQPWNGSHQAVDPLTADCCYLLFAMEVRVVTRVRAAQARLWCDGQHLEALSSWFGLAACRMRPKRPPTTWPSTWASSWG
jgi:hypothetical protein